MTEIIQSVEKWQSIRKSSVFEKKSVGFVPTMGNLHAGHESLLKRSKSENDASMLSIFVNPTQFNDTDDLKKYPRTLTQDIKVAQKIGIDYILLPNESELYPDDYQYRIIENNLSQKMEGAYRKSHFDGVLTVVLKLLLLIKADRAYFGEKDFQQLQLVSKMVEAFFIDTKIIACPIIRDQNGLALSSRNSRLSAEGYQTALLFPQLLASKKSITEIKQQLEASELKVDYIEEFQNRRYGAVTIGDIRLIDNIDLSSTP